MSGKTHPYLQTAYMSALVFFAAIFIIVFAALYVDSVVSAAQTLPAETVAENLTPPGRIYPQQ